MAALAKSKQTNLEKFYSRKFDAKNEQVYKGGVACFDRSTGLVAKAFASVNLIPIGYFIEDSAAAASKKIDIDLFHEVTAIWLKNSGTAAVIAANIGGLAYFEDDQTVANADATNTLSVAGTVWAIDSVRGVLVEPRITDDSRLGGLDA
jgi:hypothetical protein